MAHSVVSLKSNLPKGNFFILRISRWFDLFIKVASPRLPSLLRTPTVMVKRMKPQIMKKLNAVIIVPKIEKAQRRI